MALDKVIAYFEHTPMKEKVLVLEQSSATVELAAMALQTEPDRIAKTMSFLVHDEPVLIVVSGESRIDNKKYKGTFACKAKMIPFEEVEDRIGHAPGGVCPFAVNEGVKVYLDESLKKYDIVYPAAGSSNSAVRMTIAELEQYSGTLGWVDVCRAPEQQ